MAEEIMITLKRDDRIQDVVPYLEEITRPGLKVVFLISFPTNGWDELVQNQPIAR